MRYRQRIFLLILLFLYFYKIELHCQENYSVSGVVYIRDGHSDRVNLTITNKKKQIKVPVDRDGNFSVFINWNKSYIFCFSKVGYVSKSIDFKTYIPDYIDKSLVVPYELFVELFPVYPNVDSMFYTKPVAKIEFSLNKQDFDFDLDYQLAIKKREAKAKDEYLNWVKKTSTNVQKSQIEKQQHNINAIVSNEKSNEQNKLILSTDPFGLPPLKSNYPEGKTVEVFELKSKTVKRIVIKRNSDKKVYYEVKHNWGGLYHFLVITPQYYKSISKYYFDQATK